MSQTLNISDIQLFNLLKIKFGKKDAEQVVSLIKQEVENTFENKKDSLATRNDIVTIEARLGRIELKIVQIETTIAKTESKLLLWAFVFWATQLGAIFAFIKIFIK